MDFENLQRLIPHSTSEWTSEDVCKWLEFIQLPNLVYSFSSFLLILRKWICEWKEYL